MKLSEVALSLGLPFSGPDHEISNFCSDSRKVQPGDFFVAILGERVDGHEFLAEAQRKGAVGALVSRAVLGERSGLTDLAGLSDMSNFPLFKVPDTIQALGEIARQHRQHFSLPMAAITGSCGKTTVKEMLASILNTKGKCLANHGNLNTEVGVPVTLLRLEPQHQFAVIEMGACKKGDIRYLMRMASPTITLITNASVAHIGVFGSTTQIVEAKGEIYAELDQSGKAVFNLDEPSVHYWQNLLKGQKQITYGFHPDAMIRCDILKQTETGSVVNLKTPQGEVTVNLSAAGRHNISNAMAATAMALEMGLGMGLSLENVKTGLEAFLPVSGRLQMKWGPQGARIIDDTYNANPASVKAALAVLQAYPGHKIFVMGDMLELGNDAALMHQEIGKEAKRLGISNLLGFGTLTENTIRAFGENGKHFQDKSSLIEALHDLIQKESTVLVKGSRGMRMEEIVQAFVETTDSSQEKQSC